MNGVKKEAQTKTKKEEDGTSVPSSSSAQNLVLLGSAEGCNRCSESGTGSGKVCEVPQVNTLQNAQDTCSRSYRPRGKATKRFLRVGALPRKNVP